MTKFELPRILTESEANLLRGKSLMVGHPTLGATKYEVMQLIGHLDLVELKLRTALELLSSCMPDVIYITDSEWSSIEPDEEEDYEVINFRELLDA